MEMHCCDIFPGYCANEWCSLTPPAHSPIPLHASGCRYTASHTENGPLICLTDGCGMFWSKLHSMWLVVTILGSALRKRTQDLSLGGGRVAPIPWIVCGWWQVESWSVLSEREGHPKNHWYHCSWDAPSLLQCRGEAAMSMWSHTRHGAR